MSVQTDVRPFVHPLPALGTFGKVKLLFGLIFLVPLRLIAMAYLLTIYYVMVKVVTLGLRAKDYDQPLPRWRRYVIENLGKKIAKGGLFVLGFWTLDVVGEPEPTRAPTIVSNHVSYIDVLYYMSAFVPSFVTGEGVRNVPCFGFLSSTWQSLYVSSPSHNLTNGADHILKRQTTPIAKQLPPLVVFPEGTTTNGKYLLKFKSGAFVSGEPVQPVWISYPFQHFSPSWETIPTKTHFILLLAQLRNYISVIYFPPYFPSSQEKDNPQLYAENVRQLIASAVGVELSDATVKDKLHYHRLVNKKELQWSDQVDHVFLPIHQ